jgi:hypothetical protein
MAGGIIVRWLDRRNGLTEDEFLTLTKPQEAARQFNSRASPLRTTTRKARLFVCACCRRVWSHFADAGRAAIEAAERAADGLIRVKDLWPFVRASPPKIKVGGRRVRSPANYAAVTFAWVTADNAAETAAFLFACASSRVVAELRSAEESELRVQCDFLRDIIGNPFRPITLDTAHRTPTIVSLARAAYDERHRPSGELDLQRLAVLADALEEAGAPGEMVAHLREPGSHIRGCWAVDQCLGLS